MVYFVLLFHAEIFLLSLHFHAYVKREGSQYKQNESKMRQFSSLCPIPLLISGGKQPR